LGQLNAIDTPGRRSDHWTVMTPQPTGDAGLRSYRNWRAHLAGAPTYGARKAPMYSDASLVGAIEEGLGNEKLKLNRETIRRFTTLSPRADQSSVERRRDGIVQDSVRS
jgi:hypothetical protein